MTTRLYINFDDSCKVITLPDDECHYLLHVLRLKQGDPVHVFNEQVGEWQAELCDIRKLSCSIMLKQQIRFPVIEPITRLVYAPLKHDAMRFLYEKATELGVTHFQPIITDYAQKYMFHHDKIVRQLKQASQQCERLSVPIVLPAKRLDEIVHHDFCDVSLGTIFVAVERVDSPNMLDALLKKDLSLPCSIVIGPEGGFSKREVELLISAEKINCFSLGKNILRAETAAITALGCVMLCR